MSTATSLWPDGARAAVMITVNFDADLFWMRLDPSVAGRLKTRSIGEYGALRGAPRLLRALEEAKVPSTWFVCSDLLGRYRYLIETVVAAGHCVASRGRGLDDFAMATRKEQRTALEESRNELSRIIGSDPTGFRPPGDVTDDTLDLLLELGYRWSSITRGHEQPIYLCGSYPAKGALVDIPRSWELDDASRFLFNYGPPYPKGQSRIAPYAAVLADWQAELDATHAAGGCFVLSLDPQAIGSPGRIALLEELLAGITARSDIWVTTGDAMNDWWRATTTEECWPPEAIRRRQRDRMAVLQHSESSSGKQIGASGAGRERGTS